MFFKNIVLNVFYPHFCAFCGKILDRDANVNICENCISKNEFLDGRRCKICLTKLSENEEYNDLCHDCIRNKRHFTKCFSPFVYKNNVRRSILSMKFFHRGVNARAFAFMMAKCIIDEEFDLITYVPQNRKNLRKRGYNQSELLAKYLSEIILVPCRGVLKRTENSLKQSSLPKKARIENANKSYSIIPKEKVSGKVLLVDDIMTTGATADVCSRLLKKCGASEVFVVVAARNGK